MCVVCQPGDHEYIDVIMDNDMTGLERLIANTDGCISFIDRKKRVQAIT